MEQTSIGKVLLILCATTVVIFGISFVYKLPAVQSVLQQWKLIPQDEHYTELFFNNYSELISTLPTQITPGNTISFSFSIHNKEGKSMAYPYTVYVLDEHGATTTLEAKVVDLADGATMKIPASYTFPKTNVPTQAVFVVSLFKPAQSLHFYVPNK